MKVLIIEDETKLADVLTQGLKEHGIVAEAARDGSAGLVLALSRPYDAIVLDVMLPGRNGFEVLKSLRENGRATPVLMLTARSGVDDRVRGLDLGADDYLTKPFAFKELLARIRAISRRPPAEPRTVLRVGDLELDPVKREVRREGRPIDLTSREFALLELLVRKQGAVLTRAMILDQVWESDDGGAGGSNVVEVYINYLRRKVDQPFATRLIHTVRGTGYVLQERA
jgi:two-component system copper resistance phosphate regulon response regulator CusR